MKRILIYGASLLVLFTSCNKNNGPEINPLPRDNWDDAVYEGLCCVIDSLGSGSSSYNAGCKPYAVFDFDNTTIMNDTEFNLMEYGIENLKFIVEPDSMKDLMMEMLEDDEAVLKINGREIPASDLADDIVADYRVLYDKYIKSKSVSLDEVHQMTEYLDFRAKLRAMYDGVLAVRDGVQTVRWLLHFVKGMTVEQLQSITEEALDWGLAKGCTVKRTWESPDMGKTGKISVTMDSGMSLTVEILNLYNILRNQGFDVYICSAALEDIVEVVACDNKYGLGLDTAYVYGMREKMEADGTYSGYLRDDYPPTLNEGKTVCIKRYIAPSHGNKGPALVGGDSNGDYSMLSSFPDLGRGLIINRDMPAPLSTLYGKKGYLLQGRNPAKGTFIRSSISEPVK